MTAKDVIIKRLEELHQESKLLILDVKVTWNHGGELADKRRYAEKRLRQISVEVDTQFAEYNAIRAKEKAAEQLLLRGQELSPLRQAILAHGGKK